MINKEEYKSMLWGWKEVSRKVVTLNSYKPILGSVLSILWIACNNETIDINNINSYKYGIDKTISLIEEKDPKLSEALNILLNNKVQKNEERIDLIESILKDLNNRDAFTSEDIKNILNYLIIEDDLGEGRSVSLTVTPDPVKNLMVGLINPVANMKIADYFSGTGSILLKVNETYKDYNIELYGEELYTEAYFISQILLKINKIDNYKIFNKDVYDFENTEKNIFDYVLMDSPFSLNLNRDFQKNEVFYYGQPNKTRIDWGGYQVALYGLKDKGRAIVTAPTGALFRTSDKSIRKAIVDDDKIEAVIQLPRGLYQNTGVAASIIVFNKNKDETKESKIIFIDASNEYISEERQQNTISKESIEKIIDCINNNKEIEDFSIIKETKEVGENDYNLNSNVYINNRLIRDKLGKTKILNEVADVITGVQLSKKDLESLKRNPTHYYLNVKNIDNNEIIYDDQDKIRDKKVDWYGKYDIKAGDILITTRGTAMRMLVVPDDFRDSFISNNLSIIRIKQNKYDPYVLLKYLNSELGKLVLENITTGSGIMVMNARQLSSIEIPDYDMNFLKSVGERIKKNECEYRAKLTEINRLYKQEDQTLIDKLGVIL